MRPSHDSIKRDEALARDQKLTKAYSELLADTVAKDSTKAQLLIGARIVRLAKSMNFYDSWMAEYEAILKGDNKHKKDFCALLEEVSPS